MPDRFFDEEWYLAEYPDVADAVRKKRFASGFAHFNAFGRAEGRAPTGEAQTGFARVRAGEDSLQNLSATKLFKLVLGSGRISPRWVNLVLFILQLLADVRTWSFLWDTVHIHPRRWRLRVYGFLWQQSWAFFRSTEGTASEGGAKNRSKGRQDYFEQSWWNSFFARHEDPWDYTSKFVQVMHQKALDLVPPEIDDAVEIACAEGHFTIQLAARVRRLLALDISQVAVERAKARCQAVKNIEYGVYDLWRDDLPRRFDLIVCSDVLYFQKSIFHLRRLVPRLIRKLKPGGYILMSHQNVIADDLTQTGFNWEVGCGAQLIGETFARSRSLMFLRELRTPLYRVQLFRLRRRGERSSRSPREVVECNIAGDITSLAPVINWSGAAITRSEAQRAWITRELPILMYHQIAKDSPAALSRYNVTPAEFERQLVYLKRNGYVGITLDEWRNNQLDCEPYLAGRVVAITFDDAYHDFLTEAFPRLKWHGFPATVFVPTDHVQGRAEWLREYGDPWVLLSWDEIRALAAEGVAFGSHAASHRALTQMPPSEAIAELSRSRTMLQQQLNRPVTVFSYPFGAENPLIRRAVATAGYECAVSTRAGLVKLGENPFILPRVEIMGSDSLDDFIAKLGSPERATLDRRLSYYVARWTRRNLMKP